MKQTILILTILLITTFLSAQEVKINNNFVIEADGTIRMDNNATVWDDVMVYPDATSKGDSKIPTYTKFKDNGSGSQGVFFNMFSPNDEQELYFSVQLPHGYKVGSNIFPHVHWTTAVGTGVVPSGTPSGATPTKTNVVWGLEYTVSAIGGTYSNTTILTNDTVISACTGILGPNRHLITSLGIISGTGLGISTVLVCRVFRKASDLNDSFADPAGLLGIDFHYEKDTEGSRTEFTK